MGLEYARQLAARGYDLILVSNRQDELDSAVSTLSSQFPSAYGADTRTSASPHRPMTSQHGANHSRSCPPSPLRSTE